MSSQRNLGTSPRDPRNRKGCVREPKVTHTWRKTLKLEQCKICLYISISQLLRHHLPAEDLHEPPPLPFKQALAALLDHFREARKSSVGIRQLQNIDAHHSKEDRHSLHTSWMSQFYVYTAFPYVCMYRCEPTPVLWLYWSPYSEAIYTHHNCPHNNNCPSVAPLKSS